MGDLTVPLVPLSQSPPEHRLGENTKDPNHCNFATRRLSYPVSLASPGHLSWSLIGAGLLHVRVRVFSQSLLHLEYRVQVDQVGYRVQGDQVEHHVQVDQV